MSTKSPDFIKSSLDLFTDNDNIWVSKSTESPEPPANVEAEDPDLIKFRSLPDQYRRMTPTQFRKYAKEQVRLGKWDPLYRDMICVLQVQYRRTMRSKRITVSARENTWANLFHLRTKEAQQISARLDYQQRTESNPKLAYALAQYRDLLTHTLLRMRDVQARYSHHGGRVAAVKAYNRDREAAGKSQVSNNGEYWEDWVTPSARQKITKLFNEAMADRAVHARWSQPFTKERPLIPRRPNTRDIDPTEWDDMD